MSENNCLSLSLSLLLLLLLLLVVVVVVVFIYQSLSICVTPNAEEFEVTMVPAHIKWYVFVVYILPQPKLLLFIRICN